MTDDKICVASGDGHVGAPIEVYKDYLEKRLHPFYDEYYTNHASRWSPQSKSCFFDKRFNSKMWDTEGFDPERGTPVVWDPELRLKALDAEMIACEVMVPDDQNINDPPFGSGLANAMVEGPEGSKAYPAELIRAGARSYNRWLADFCATDNARLHGAIILGTLDDVVWCADEIERAYNSGLRSAVMLPLEYDQPLLFHPRYDPLWDVCSELGLAVLSHIGTGAPRYLGEDPKVQSFFYSQHLFWAAQRPIPAMIMGGVFDRYPKLHLIPTEIQVFWVPEMIAGMDYAADHSWGEMQASRDVPRRVDLSMKPSEFWQRNVFVTHSHSQRREQFEEDAWASVPNMVFGTDTGHAEGWWPKYGFPEPKPSDPPPMFDLPVYDCDEAYSKLWAGLPADRIVEYLSDNFFRAFPNVSKEELKDVTDRIGPIPSELGLV
jgi:predicted TIM-barrel fold metal-dependent hydrolase